MEPFTLNLPNIINSSTTWGINKSIATKLSLVPNFTVGEFIQSLSDTDMEFLMGIVDQHDKVSEHDASELFLLMILLATAEGLEYDDEFAERRYNALCMIITLESLHRKGLVNFKRENASLGEDCDHLLLAESTELGNEFIQRLKDEGEL